MPDQNDELVLSLATITALEALSEPAASAAPATVVAPAALVAPDSPKTGSIDIGEVDKKVKNADKNKIYLIDMFNFLLDSTNMHKSNCSAADVANVWLGVKSKTDSKYFHALIDACVCRLLIIALSIKGLTDQEKDNLNQMMTKHWKIACGEESGDE